MRLNPCLHIDGRCEEAFRFYEQCLGGQIELLLRFGESPMADRTPPSHHDEVMHVRLRFGDNVLMGVSACCSTASARPGWSTARGRADAAGGGVGG
jgi:PhnB protein